MKKIALLALLLPALTSAGTFVSDGSTFPHSPKSDAVTCKVPYSQQWCAADITARDNAIYDLRAAVLALQGGTMTQVAWASITGVPTSFPSAWAQISNKPTTFASDWTLVANKPASYQPPLATASSIGGVYADPPCATGYVFKGHGLDGHAICKALGEEIYLALRTTDGNPPADPNQLVWFDGSSGATPTVGPPMFTPIAGTYAGGQNVALSSSTTGAVFCYTVGGSTPAASTPGSCSAGNLYTGPIPVSSNLTLKAVATKVGYTNSTITSGDYVINNSVAAPTLAPPAGSYVGAQSVTMTSATTGATLCLTSNGSDPAASTPGSCSAGMAYTNGLTASVPQTLTLKLLATKAGMANSSIVTAAYTIASHPADLFSPAAGPVTSGTTIIVGSNTPACNAYIYWNTTGSPTTGDSHGTVTTAITAPTTIYTKVIGCPGVSDSTVASASYTITGVAQAAAPTFSPTPGTVAVGTSVYATTTTPSGVVHCTWDGSAPTSGSSTAVVPHIVNTTETLRCITVASGYTDSAEASATYTVQQAATPTFSPAAGAVATGTVITPSSTTPSSTLRCTTDGSDPTSGSTATPTVTVSPPVTVKCRATATGYLASSIASASYTQAQAATPTITPNGGSISGTTSVTLACSSPSPTIRYTTDGSTPNGSSTTYSGAFNVSATTTVKAICQSSGMSDSAVATASFTLADAGGPFTDTFATLNSTYWQSATANGGTLTPSVSGLSLNYMAGATAAGVVALKSNVLQEAKIFSVDLDPYSALTLNHEFDVISVVQGASWPGTGAVASLANNILITVDEPEAGTRLNVYYWDAANVQQTLVQNTVVLDDAGQRRIVLETTTTQWRVRVLTTIGGDLLTTAWVNWSSTRNNGTSRWLQLGRYFTDSLDARQVSITLTRFERQ